MTQPSQAEVVFFAALEKATPAERAGYLEDACAGDDTLRRRVETLLAAHPQVGQFLERPIVEAEGVAALCGEENAAADLSSLTPSTRPDSLGRLGHYEVLQVLGQGGFGIVLRAFDEALQRVVAVKVLAPRMAATSPARKRFLREARSSAKVRHENVVQVHAVEEQPLPYLVMEFIPGETLQQRLDRTGPLDTMEVVKVGRQIAEGLAAAHGMGLIHRDIKPANILIEAGPHQRVKITDFGLARAADDSSLTQSGMVPGTPMFMAPEQAQGETLDHRADLFSLGSVLYTMCTGRPPFRAKSTFAVLKRVAEDTPRPIMEMTPDAPPWLCAIITRLHAKKPEDRFASAQELADLLAQHLDQLLHPGTVETLPMAVSPSREIPNPRQATRSRFRTRSWVVAAGLLTILLGSLGFAEAIGATNIRGTVIRLFSPEGTLVVEVDDPEVSVKIDGSELVITGAGAKEIRLKPGNYTVEARKDGKIVRRELVTVTTNGKQVVRVSQEAVPPDAKAAKAAADAAAWERAVAGLSAAQQVKFVVARMQDLNPGFDGKVAPTIENGVVTGLGFSTEQLKNFKCAPGKLIDLSPLKGMPLTSLQLWGGRQVQDLTPLKGMPLTWLVLNEVEKVKDLTPLKGMPLTSLELSSCQVQDLTPLEGMPLSSLILNSSALVKNLTPLKGMPLNTLILSHCRQVQDVSPLKGMPLTWLTLDDTQVRDLEPLKDMPLKKLYIDASAVTDLRPLQGMPLEDIRLTPKNITQGLQILRDMKSLNTIGLSHYEAWPAAEFWNRYDKGEFKK